MLVLDVDLVRDPEPEHGGERADAVAPADLLALLVGPARVADRDLEDPRLALRELDRELGLEAEVVRDDWDRLEQGGADGLVAGLHVRQVHVRDQVRQEREEPVADLVPVEERAPGLAAREARAEDRVRGVLDEDLHDPEQVARVVLEVRVVDDGDLALRVREGGPHRGALPAVPLVLEEHPVDPAVAAAAEERRGRGRAGRAARTAAPERARSRAPPRTPAAPRGWRRATSRPRRPPARGRGGVSSGASRDARATSRRGAARCRRGRGRSGTSAARRDVIRRGPGLSTKPALPPDGRAPATRAHPWRLTAGPTPARCSRSASARSDSIISRTSSWNDVRGFQPSFFCAFEASARRKSTSVGR